MKNSPIYFLNHKQMLMKYLIIICSALLTLTGVYAQPENDNRDERIESLKIAFITEKLALSSK